jgi:hypothetical protein
VLPNGTAYRASIEVSDSTRYDFTEAGLLGGATLLKVSDIQVTGNCTPSCQFKLATPSVFDNRMAVTFAEGNYTISYMAPLRNNKLEGAFDAPYQVKVSLPEEFDVRNPLLAGLSFGANVTRNPDNSTTVRWDKATSFDLRFYDQEREELLYLFGNFFIIIAIVLLMPYLLTMRKKG